MSMIYCTRCDAEHDSDLIDCVPDPADTKELAPLVCWESLTKGEKAEIESIDFCSGCGHKTCKCSTHPLTKEEKDQLGLDVLMGRVFSDSKKQQEGQGTHWYLKSMSALSHCAVCGKGKDHPNHRPEQKEGQGKFHQREKRT